jgi:Leucine-rich repeat (LRR) protein
MNRQEMAALLRKLTEEGAKGTLASLRQENDEAADRIESWLKALATPAEPRAVLRELDGTWTEPASAAPSAPSAPLAPSASFAAASAAAAPSALSAPSASFAAASAAAAPSALSAPSASFAAASAAADRIESWCMALATPAGPRTVLRELDAAYANYAWTESFVLTRNNIGDAGISALADTFQRGCMPNLRKLDLSHNRIADAGGRAIAAALKGMPFLQELNFSFNPVSDETARALATAIAADDAPHLQMSAAVFEGTLVTPVGVQAVEDAIKAAALARAARKAASS